MCSESSGDKHDSQAEYQPEYYRAAERRNEHECRVPKAALTIFSPQQPWYSDESSECKKDERQLGNEGRRLRVFRFDPRSKRASQKEWKNGP